MYKIIDDKCSGKTKKLIDAASKNKGIVVCKNAYSTRAKSIAYGFHGAKYMSYDDAINNLNALDNLNGLYIDELEDFVTYLLKGKLSGYTLSKEEQVNEI